MSMAKRGCPCTHVKYRSRTDISVHNLEIAATIDNGSATKTTIMYGAFLPYFQLKDYLSTLIENGLLEYVPESNRYRTAQKCLKFLPTIN